MADSGAGPRSAPDRGVFKRYTAGALATEAGAGLEIKIGGSLVSRLAKDYPHICGIKDTSDNVAHMRELVLQVKGVRG